MSYHIGDFVKVEKDGAVFEGHVVLGDIGYITLKMTGGGYIAGFLENDVKVTILKENDATPGVKPVPAKVSKQKNSKKITIVSAGGTIACSINPATGTVSPRFSAADILTEVPELETIADIQTRDVFQLLSENMTPAHWTTLAEAVCDEIKKGADGIIVTNGTDTMAYVAAALAYMIETPVPIVFTGAQRSPDRPGSDNHMNLLCAAHTAVGDIAEVLLVMHGSMSDSFCAVHRAVKVRKMHTSRRDTFKSINMQPLAAVDYKSGALTLTSDYVPYTKRGEKKLALKPALESRCAIVKFVPGASPSIFDYYLEQGCKGIVIEGTGLGHVSGEWIAAIQKLTDHKIPVVVSSQCIYGSTAFNTYETGRKMAAAGAVEAFDQITESVYVKLMWLLGQGFGYEEIKELIVTEMKGDMSQLINE
jgi:glutamyl-tRNA(Gln) amidotransferase subunit D